MKSGMLDKSPNIVFHFGLDILRAVRVELGQQNLTTDEKKCPHL